MVVSERTTEGNVKFISYDGHYPNLCSGTLELEVNGKRYRFGSQPWGRKTELFKTFWHSGGRCGFHGNYDSPYTERNEWEIEEGNLPEELKAYSAEIDRVFNDNVPYGCCGGCL